jgi:hypothetical protein
MTTITGHYTGHIADQPTSAQLQPWIKPEDCGALDATSCISAGSVQCHLIFTGYPFATLTQREPIDWDALFSHLLN